MLKIIIRIVFLVILFIPSQVFAINEDDLLEAFTNATGYSYSTLNSGSVLTYEDFVNKAMYAHDKFLIYKEIKGFDWECVEPVCHGDFVENLRQCDSNLMMLNVRLIGLRHRYDRDEDKAASESFDKAKEHLKNAFVAWDKVIKAQAEKETPAKNDTETPAASDDGGGRCFISSFTYE